MLRFVFILIIIVLLVRCSAYSTSTNETIHLVSSQEKRLVMQNSPITLDLDKPFMVNIYSRTPLYGLLCKKAQNLSKIIFKVRLKILYKNVYTITPNIVATKALPRIWECTLSYTPDDIDGVKFHLKVRNINSTYSEVTTVSGDYGFRTLQKSHYAMTTNKTIYQTTVYQHTARNDDTAAQKNTKDKAIEVNNTIQDNTEAPEQHANNVKGSFNTSTLIIIIAVAITLSVIVVGGIAVTVCRTSCSRKTSVEEPGTRNDSGASDTVYEELDLAAYKAESAEDVANRPPHPLPFEEREENKKYIHYDTPYDHRFMRRIPEPNSRHRNVHVLKRL